MAVNILVSTSSVSQHQQGPVQLTIAGHVGRLLREQRKDIVGQLLGLIAAAGPGLLAAARSASAARSVHTVSTSTLTLQGGGIQMSLDHDHDRGSGGSRGGGAYSCTRPAAVTTSPSSPAVVMVSQISPVTCQQSRANSKQASKQRSPTRPIPTAPLRAVTEEVEVRRA